MSAPGCHIFLWYASLICQAVCNIHTGVRILILLFTRLVILHSADKAVWMHITFSNRECMLSSIVRAILVSIAILTKKGFAKGYDSIAR